MSKSVLVIDKENHYEVKDVLCGSMMPMDVSLKMLEVDDIIGNIIQTALKDGNVVGILKTANPHIRMIDLIIDNPDDLEILRRKSLQDIQDLM